MSGQDQPATQVDVTAQDYADGRLVTVAGRVDHTNADQFRDALTAQAEGIAKGGGMAVDLGSLEFITSAGLRALFLVNKTLSKGEAKLVVTGIKGVVREVFRISNFDTILSVASSPGAALSQISSAAAEAYSG